MNLKFIQENLALFSFCIAFFSLCISICALVATWANFLNSRRTFFASNYPKIKATLYLHNRDSLPVYHVSNESEKVTANDIRIEVSIRNLMEFSVFKGKWFLFTLEQLARLKPLEGFVPSGMSSDDLIQWLKDNGHQPAPPVSVADQEILSRISVKKSYTVRLNVYYTSSVFRADKVCKISKKYKLVACSNLEAKHPRDQFYWKLVG